MRRCITKSLLLLALFCGRSTSVAHENDWTASSNTIFGQTSILLGEIAEKIIDIDKASKHIKLGVDIVRYFYNMQNAIEKLTMIVNDIEAYCREGVSGEQLFEYMKAVLKHHNLTCPSEVCENMAKIKPNVMKHQVQDVVRKFRSQISQYKTSANMVGATIAAANVYLGCAAVYQFANSSEDLSKQAKKISKIKKKVKQYLKWFLEDVLSQTDASKRQRQVDYFATKIDESTYQMEIVKLKVETIAQRSRDTATKNILVGVPTFALGYIFPPWIGGIMKASGAFSTVTGVMHVKIVWDSDQFGRDIQEALAEFKDMKIMINAERDSDLPIFEDFD